MAKLNRRRLLLSGLAAGTGSAIAAQRAIAQTPNPPRPPAPRQPPRESTDLFGLNNTVNLPAAIANSPITPPTPYDRERSKLLLQCCNIAYEQYDVGLSNPSYDGSIKSLKSYTPLLDGYTQTASFKSVEDLAGFSLQGTSVPEILQNVPLAEIERRIPEGLREEFSGIVQRVVNPKTVFQGFALTSSRDSIIVFRGTQTANDWVTNLRVRQVDYVQGKATQGRVHRGFLGLYTNVQAQVKTALRGLNSALPCYVTGHSLGAALATLATADLSASGIKSQLRLYTYASPRVGNPDFAQFFNTAVPNTYRVFNMADIVPEIPASQSRNTEFRHVGQIWSFLFYAGDIAPSHSTAVYGDAIAKQVEVNRLPTFPI